MNKRVLFLLLAVLVLPCIGMAQQSRIIKGSVVDTLSRRPITDVHLSAADGKLVVLTDNKGNFRYVLPQGAEAVLYVRHVGYESKRVVIQGDINPSAYVIELFPKIFMLGEYVVEGKISPLAIISEIPELQIRQSSNRDVGDFLREVPNLSAVRKGGSGLDPVVRGLRYNQLNVQLDQGIRIEGGCPNRMDPTTAHVEIEDVSGMEVIKGPYVLKYGPSFGGIINLNTYQPSFYDKPSIHGVYMTGFESNWNGSRQHLRLDGGNKKWSFQASGSYKNYGSYQDGESNSIQSGFKKYSYAAGIGYKPGENQSIIFNYRESHGRDVFYPALPMDEIVDDTRIYSLDYRADNLSKRLQSVEAKLFYTQVYHEMDNSFRPNYGMMQAVAKVDASNAGARFMGKWTLGETFLAAGMDAENTTKDGKRVMKMTMTMPGMPPSVATINTNLWYDAVIFNSGIFAEVRRPYKNFNLEFSARADVNRAVSADTLMIVKEGVSYFDKTGSSFTNLSFSGGFTRSLGKGYSLSFAAGRGVRSPSMTERYIKFLTVGYDMYDYLGNPLLKPEAIHQADLTVRYGNERYGRFYANVFAAFITDYITGYKLAPTVATPKTSGAVGVKQFYNADLAFLRGFELSYQSPALFSCLYVVWQGAYTRASIDEAIQYTMQNGQVVDQQTLTNDPLPEIPPMETTLKLSAKLLKDKLFPSLSARMVASQDYVAEAFFEPATPGFAILDASISYTPWRWLSLAAGVNNLLDKQYYEHLNRKIVGSTLRLYEPGRVFHVNLIASF